MDGERLTPADESLIAEAEDAIRERHEPGRHSTGVAVRTGSGRTVTSVSFKTGPGVTNLHAEPLAVARAVLDGAEGFETIVAVQLDDGERRIVSACGSCREFLLTYAPNVSVIVDEGGDTVKYPLADLIPAR